MMMIWWKWNAQKSIFTIKNFAFFSLGLLTVYFMMWKQCHSCLFFFYINNLAKYDFIQRLFWRSVLLSLNLMEVTYFLLYNFNALILKYPSQTSVWIFIHAERNLSAEGRISSACTEENVSFPRSSTLRSDHPNLARFSGFSPKTNTFCELCG